MIKFSEFMEESKNLVKMTPDQVRAYIRELSNRINKMSDDAKRRGERFISYSPNNRASLSKENIEYNKLQDEQKAAMKFLSAMPKNEPPRKAPSAFGNSRGYGQGRYMGD